MILGVGRCSAAAAVKHVGRRVGLLARLGSGWRLFSSSKHASAEAGASWRPGFLTAERMRELQRVPSPSLPEVLRTHLPHWGASAEEAPRPDLASVASVAEART